eukprot:tig00000076_g2418.t1
MHLQFNCICKLELSRLPFALSELLTRDSSRDTDISRWPLPPAPHAGRGPGDRGRGRGGRGGAGGGAGAGGAAAGPRRARRLHPRLHAPPPARLPLRPRRRAPERAWRLRVAGEGAAVALGPLARALLAALAPDPASAPAAASVAARPGLPRGGPSRRWRARLSRRQLRGRQGPLALPVRLASSPAPPSPPRAPPAPPRPAPPAALLRQRRDPRPGPVEEAGPSPLPLPSDTPPDTPPGVQVVADVLESLLVALAGVAGPAAPAAPPAPPALARARRLADEARERARAALRPALPAPGDPAVDAVLSYGPSVRPFHGPRSPASVIISKR